ncbi:hypothetical protein CLV62_13923 [Dysgonomonas alginatilytica]|uniref:Uncharacterized protein n=1 Tax=Dysgonomonas alginatilytica TaxID=1605892 RepID=A0A2V3PJ20_9BACT|nr:hypothetical protein [Dysgonomonas alginatilytica]PXV59286.1 hypothetical protein CLV62_13923 [Dysgonomonas alginatilytica]
MKTKTILTVISLTAFLFTSCEKDEMGVGGTDGGGVLPGANMKVRTIETTSIESLKNEITQTDSISDKEYLRP